MITRAKYLLEKTIVNVEEAVEIRDSVPKQKRKSLFECIHCGEPVKPHTGKVSPHFEHYIRNSSCVGI